MSLLSRLGFAFYALCGLFSAFFISWVIWAKFDFGYSFLYDAINIEEHVQEFGPQNRFRRAFHRTEKPEHVRLFAAINEAVHAQGNGLEDIMYHTPQGQAIDVMLRHAEVVHLKDVSVLIDVFKVIALSALLIWLSVSCYHITKRKPLPSVKLQTLSLLILSIACTAIIFAIGPVTIFYAFHELLFPADNQWFFYYQESLMTILMKAPYLFGWIAVLIAGLALPLYVAAIYFSARWARTETASTHGDENHA